MKSLQAGIEIVNSENIDFPSSLHGAAVDGAAHILLIDDNMFYRSMRREYHNIARCRHGLDPNRKIH